MKSRMMYMDILSEVLKDERGSWSAARTFLFGSLVFTGALIVLDSMMLAVPEVVYTLLGSFNMGLVAWAGGPRVAQYLAPQVGAMASGIAQAVKGPRQPKMLDNSPGFKENDEK
jgi:hypothetical protein